MIPISFFTKSSNGIIVNPEGMIAASVAATMRMTS